MVSAIDLQLPQLQKALDITREQYPSYAEFLEADHSENITHILRSVSRIKEHMLPGFVGALKNSELEYLLLALAESKNEQMRNMLESALVLRFKKKLYELNWVMLQRDYANKNLLRSMKKLVICLKEKYPEDFAASIFSRLFSDDFNDNVNPANESLPEGIHQLLVSENSDIHSFYSKYALLHDSPLADRVSEPYFLSCAQEGFRRNRTHFAKLLDKVDAKKRNALVCSYLDRLEVLEYFEEINVKIAEDPDQYELPKALMNKFKRWQGLKRIEAHFGSSSKEFRLWTGYFELIKRVVRHKADGLLFMYFGTFVAVDCKVLKVSEEDPSEDSEFEAEKQEYGSYIYDRGYFERELEHYELVKSDKNVKRRWRVISEHIVDARDLIIENIKSEVYRVGYSGVQLLYLKELLKIMLDPTKG